MYKYPCKDCKDRHFICWDTCEKYQKAKKLNESSRTFDEHRDYILSKGKKFKTRYGWRG